MDYKLEISKVLNNLDIGMDVEDIYLSMEVPPNKEMGDYAFPCFRLAKTFRKSPNMIAEDLKDKIESDILAEVKNVGPYLNFFIDKQKLAEYTLLEVFNKAEKYGSSNMGEGKNIIVEYSSTNIAKPFHIGHIRSTVQGDALKRIHKHLGYNTIAINYLGDYGTQFGILISAYRRWGDKEAINRDPINELLKLYVRYNSEAEDKPEMMDEARDWFNKLENKNPEALELWSWFKDISLKEFKRVYDLLNIEFDSFDGEHYHSQFIPSVIEELEEKNLLVESENAKIVDLSDKDVAPALIVKSNGSSTYITRDIATAIYRKDHYKFDENIYVVATQQNLHFQQLKYVLEKMGYDWYDQCHHVAFGMVGLKDGTMSTRKGKVVFLEDVLNQSIDKTLSIIEERNPDLENKEEVAKQIGIGAIKFQELFNNRIKDYTFDWDEILNFEGETGPYVQYTYARANSILNKYGQDVVADVDFSFINSKEEMDLVTTIYNLPQVIVNAKNKYEPSLITRHLTEIAKAFNKFYNTTHILNLEENEKKAKILLVYATKMSIAIGMNLLGIDCPEKM